jgi:periplasmic divalent cation tolerance protein
VLTTCAKASDAEKLGRALLERRLAACVSIVPGVRSLYHWQGRIEDDAELLLLIKTTAEAVEALKATLAEIHPYDVPEMVVLTIDDGSESYLAWLDANVSRTE